VLAATGLVLAGLVVVLSAGNVRFGSLRMGLPVGAAVAIAAAISLPGSPPGGLVALWALLAVGLVVGLLGRRYGARRGQTELSGTKASRVVRAVRIDPPHAPQPHFPSILVDQQFARGQTEDGRDICQGTVRSRFAAGQRTEIVHVAFCPPFQTTPQLEIEPLEGPDVEVKPTQTLPYGARMELRLSRVARTEETTLVRFSATEARPAKIA
jgi:hypothetical protein